MNRTSFLTLLCWLLLLTGAGLAWLGAAAFFLGTPEDKQQMIQQRLPEVIAGRFSIGLVFASPPLVAVIGLALLQKFLKKRLLISGFDLPFGWVALGLWTIASAIGTWIFIVY
jgi:hypothetical protein